MSMLHKCHTSFFLSKVGRDISEYFVFQRKYSLSLQIFLEVLGCFLVAVAGDPLELIPPLLTVTSKTQRDVHSTGTGGIYPLMKRVQAPGHINIYTLLSWTKMLELPLPQLPLHSTPLPSSEAGKRPGQRHIPASACKSGETTGPRRRASPTGFPFSSEARTLGSLTEHRHLAADGSNIRGWVAVPPVSTPE